MEVEVGVLVDFGCDAGAGVAQDLGGGFQVAAFSQDGRGKGMAESVGRELAGDTGFCFGRRKAGLDRFNRFACPGDYFIEVMPVVFPPRSEKIHKIIVQGNDPERRAVFFCGADQDGLLIPIDVRPFQAQEFSRAGPEPGVIAEGQSPHQVRGGVSQEPLGLIQGDGLDYSIIVFGLLVSLQRIPVDDASFFGPVQDRHDIREISPNGGPFYFFKTHSYVFIQPGGSKPVDFDLAQGRAVNPLKLNHEFNQGGIFDVALPGQDIGFGQVFEAGELSLPFLSCFTWVGI